MRPMNGEGRQVSEAETRGQRIWGIGIPDYTSSGEEVAQEIFTYISKRETEDEGNKSRR